MKLTLKPWVIGAVAAGAMVMGTTAFASNWSHIQKTSTLRVAVANEIPYGYMDINGEAKGAGPDVLKAVAKELGIKHIKWTTTSFGSLIPGLKANRFDVVAAEMAVRPERCKQVLYSEPNTSYGEGLLVKKGNPDDIHSYQSFATSGHKVAVMAGADQLGMLQKLNVPADQIVTISTNADAISAVSTGRVAAYAATGMTAYELAKKATNKVQVAQDFKDPVIDGKVVRSWGAFAFSKKSPKLRDEFNKALLKFKKTPAWENILLGYGFSKEDAAMSSKRTTAQLCKTLGG